MKLSRIVFSLAAGLIAATILISSGSKPVRVFMAGDSTMADKVFSKTVFDSISGDSVSEAFLERGWGQLLPEFLDKNSVVINYAKNGRSTKTFLKEGHWAKIIDQLEKGDIVIIQFGHNDAALSKGERYTSPEEYRNNLLFYIQQVWEKGGNPILCTPVARRKFEKGELVHSHGVYPFIVKSVAKETGVPMIDMENCTYDWLSKTGEKKSRDFFHKFAPGVSKLYPKGLDDNTHYNEKGARKAASLFVEAVKSLDNENLKTFKKHLK